MHLSDTIIYGTVSDVRKKVRVTEELSYLDEYGYTPLIETAIADETEKAKILIEADADVNQKDITGRTALHWAASNNNAVICELLLARGADPNAYYISSEPVLAKPLLCDNSEIKELLKKHGANFTFAYDYINVKLLGHRFELVGSVDIADPKDIFTEVDYEGFYLEFSLALISRSLKDYRDNFAAVLMRDWFGHVNVIYEALDRALALQKFDHYLIDYHKHLDAINSLLNHDPLIIPIGQEGHAMTVVKCGQLLAICDRAKDVLPNDSIAIYFMNRPSRLSNELVCDLMYRNQPIEIIHDVLRKQCALKQVAEIPLHSQVVGNCSWANVEAVIPALYCMLRMNDPDNILDKYTLANDSLELLHRWQSWDIARSLQFFIRKFRSARAARKVSIAAVLAGILFQTCSADNPEHIKRAKRIIPILKTEGNEYILQSYIKSYLHDKSTKAGKNLKRLLDIYDLEETYG